MICPNCRREDCDDFETCEEKSRIAASVSWAMFAPGRELEFGFCGICGEDPCECEFIEDEDEFIEEEIFDDE